MPDRPIIFSAPMVRALIDGRKSQTRRILNPQPPAPPAPNCHPSHKQKHPAPYLDAYCGQPKTPSNPRGMGTWWQWWQVDDRACLPQFNVGYAPGDRLYVREAWRAMDGQDEFSGSQIEALCREAGYKRPWCPIQFEADGARDNWIAEPRGFGTKAGRYRHARFMPRWASRLTLTVTEVRVQRLQDISEADAMAEGCRPSRWEAETPRDHFRTLWNSLHGPDAWDANPWVCAITFTVRQGNIDHV